MYKIEFQDGFHYLIQFEVQPIQFFNFVNFFKNHHYQGVRGSIRVLVDLQFLDNSNKFKDNAAGVNFYSGNYWISII